MNLRELLASLEAAGIRLTARGDKLRYSCLPGALTDDLRLSILEHKAELLRMLTPVKEIRPISLAPSLTRDGTCHICSGTRWWLSRFGHLVCGECHPPPTPALVVQWLDREEAAHLAREVDRR